MSCQIRPATLTTSTLCFAKHFNAHVRVSIPDPLPLGPAVLWLEIRWTPPAPEAALELVFRRLSGTSADVRFHTADGLPARTFTGDVTGDQGLIRIVGVTPSGSTQPDLMLDLKVDGERQGEPIPVQVRRDPSVTGNEGLAALRSELAIAALVARPTTAAQQGIWDRYNDLFSQARTFADALAAAVLAPATVPLLRGRTTEHNFNRDEIVAHLRTNPHRSGTAADKARGKTNGFDGFQGTWRGSLRRHNDCGAYASICQDYERRATEPVAVGSDIYVQPALGGVDSRSYVIPPSPSCADLPSGRDTDAAAMVAINVTTGILVGATGVQAQAGADGVRGQRPCAGFFVGDGRLLWVAEEQRAETQSTYAVYSETVEDLDGIPAYTLAGFTFVWDRSQHRLTSPIVPLGGQFRQVLTPEAAALARAFQDRRLQLAHLQDMRYRRRLESLDVATVERFLANADDATRPYLEHLLEFVHQQTALAAAPLGSRTSITFIMGEDPPQTANLFYTGATAHFLLNPAGQRITALRTLRRVRDHLDAHRPADGQPWGEVNLVMHANEEGGMSVPVAPLPAGVNPDFHLANPITLRAAIDDGTFQRLADPVVDVRTVLNIRGCALGQSPDMLRLLSIAFGGNETQRPIVRAPKTLQAFEFFPANWRPHHVNAPVSSDLYFIEFWFVGFPQGQQPNNATLINRFNAKYAGVGINWAEGLRNVGPPAGDRLSHEMRARTYQFTFSMGYFPIPANNQALANLLSQIGGVFSGLSNVQETGRNLLANGRTNITFDAVQNGNPFNGNLETGPSPPANDVARLAVVANDATVLADIATVGHGVNDYTWVFVQNDVAIGNGERQWTLEATGRHTILRIQRELHEPDPNRPGRTRRAHPPVTDLTHFGEEVPARPATQPLGENVLP